MSHDGDQADRGTDVPFAALEGLEDLPLSDHVAAFEAVHEALRARLEGRPAPVPGEAVG